MMTDKSISIIVACYNDAVSIQEMLRRIHASMKGVTPHYEIIYVNDASPDNAQEILLNVLKDEPKLTLLTPPRNFRSPQGH